MKSGPKLKKGQFGVCSNIAQIHSSSLYDIISGHYWLNAREMLTKKWN